MHSRARSEQILQFLEDHRQEMIEFTCELVATPSPNPPGDERAVAELILHKMVRLGLNGAEVAAREPERPNILYRQAGSGGAPRLLLNGHLDTKPVGSEDRKLWRTDPMVPTLSDGKLFGLGAADMKGGVAAMLYAAAALDSLSEPPQGDLLVVLTANEEAPGEYGANWLVKNHDIQADFCLVADTAGMKDDFDYLPVCARSTVLFKVKVHGTQMHSSISDQFPAVNASVKMGWVLWRMARDLQLRYEPHPYYPKGPTINLGDIVSGGLAYGTFPGYAEFASDIRIIPGMTQEAVKADLEEFVAGLRHEDAELSVELEFEGKGKEMEWNGSGCRGTSLSWGFCRMPASRSWDGGYPWAAFPPLLMPFGSTAMRAFQPSQPSDPVCCHWRTVRTNMYRPRPSCKPARSTHWLRWSTSTQAAIEMPDSSSRARWNPKAKGS